MTIEEAKAISKGKIDHYSDDEIKAVIGALGQLADAICDRLFMTSGDSNNSKMRMQYDQSKKVTSSHFS